MKKLSILTLLVITMVFFNNVLLAQNKTMQKERDKEYKTKMNEFKSENYKVVGTSKSLDVALLEFYEKLNTEMVAVKGGTFTIGCTWEQGEDPDCQRGEYPAHQVTLDDYYMGKYEVTQGLWEAVMGSNPSRFKSGANYPVETVGWDDCQDFIKKLNSLTGKNFRLPTAAEWEYAARGGNKAVEQTKYAGSNDIDEVAWYGENSGGKSHAVGTKKPNALGLYDMSGNVYEWCSDLYRDYSRNSVTNPQGSSSGRLREIRGGGWCCYDSDARVSCRNEFYSDNRSYNYGFRLAYSSSK